MNVRIHYSTKPNRYKEYNSTDYLNVESKKEAIRKFKDSESYGRMGASFERSEIIGEVADSSDSADSAE